MTGTNSTVKRFIILNVHCLANGVFMLVADRLFSISFANAGRKRRKNDQDNVITIERRYGVLGIVQGLRHVDHLQTDQYRTPRRTLYCD